VVRESIAPGTWNERSNNSLRTLPGALVVRHRPARQKQVESLLGELRVLINPSQLDPTIGGLR